MGCQIDEIQDLSLDAVYGHVKKTFLASPALKGCLFHAANLRYRTSPNSKPTLEHRSSRQPMPIYGRD